MDVSEHTVSSKVQIQLAILNSHHGVTVKDVPAKEFIEAFAKHLKKGNKIKMPQVRPSIPGRVVDARRSVFLNSYFKLYYIVGRLL